MSNPYPAYSCTGGPNEEVIEEIVQTTSGILSVIGSGFIVLDVLRKLFMEKNGVSLTDPYQRIMLGLSFFDIMTSFFDNVMGTWITPKETGWWMAIGNEATCTAQGFFTAFGFMGSFGYQIALSLNILLLISFGWSQKRFACTVEIPMHIFIFVVSLAYGIIPLPLDSYNPQCGQCLVLPLEYECNDPAFDGELCVRGSPMVGLVWYRLFLAALWIMIIFCTLAMGWIYISVRRQEVKQTMYRFPGEATRDYHRESRRIRKILLLYTVALYVCWGVPLTIIFMSIELDAAVPFGVWAVIETLIPLIGFFNMLVYFLPNSLTYQKAHPGTWLVVSYWYIIIPQSKGCCLWCSKLFTNYGTSGDDVTDEAIMESSDLNFAMHNISHNKETRVLSPLSEDQ